MCWKKQLEGKLNNEEGKEFERLDEENTKTVKEVYEKLKNDKKIMEQMKKIKSYPWVRVIEGKKDGNNS